MMVDEKAEEIISLYKKYGNEDYIGEPVSQIEHMCQCAELAEQEGFDNEVILAAFLHDVGHLCEHIMPVETMNGFGVRDHEKLGYTYLLEKGFSKRVAEMVASHVAAKRYLTFKFPDYYNQLSEASKQTLVQQGGVMNENEAAAFEANPSADVYIALRRWDEQAKMQNKPLPDLKKYRQLIKEHLQQQETKYGN